MSDSSDDCRRLSDRSGASRANSWQPTWLGARHSRPSAWPSLIQPSIPWLLPTAQSPAAVVTGQAGGLTGDPGDRPRTEDRLLGGCPGRLAQAVRPGRTVREALAGQPAWLAPTTITGVL